jgi:hypothetical protein
MTALTRIWPWHIRFGQIVALILTVGLLGAAGALLSAWPYGYATQVPHDPIVHYTTTAKTVGYHTFHHGTPAIMLIGGFMALIFGGLCVVAFIVLKETWEDI